MPLTQRVLAVAIPFVVAAVACGAAPRPAPPPPVAAAPPPASPPPAPAAEPAPPSEPVAVAEAAPAPAPEKDPAAGTPEGMVFVPAGEFHMGCNEGVDDMCRPDERPGRKIHLDAFHIDTNEVTVRDWARCVEGGKCSAARMNGFEPKGAPIMDEKGMPASGAQTPIKDWGYCNWGKPGREDYPINCVSWHQANSYCEWAGKRLPTEAEWEKAARGTDGRRYPWGNEIATCELTVTYEGGKGCGREVSSPVGSRPRGVSPYGAMDMAGNIWEWVADWYDPDYLARAPDRNPKGPETGTTKVGKGGCWGSGNIFNLRASSRHAYIPTYRSNSRLGFRCAKQG